MRSLKRDWFGVSRAAAFRVIPLGDIHLGAAACDEKLLRRVVKRIGDDPTCYWVGLGDYCFTLDAEILTRDGFRRWDELHLGEEVLGYDGQGTCWTSLEGVYFNPSALTVRLHSKSFAVVCTAQHGWIVKDGHQDRWTGQRRKRAKWPRKVTTEGLKTHHKLVVAAPCKEGGIFSLTEEEAALIGWVVTDGCISYRGGITFTADIAQSKEPYRTQIRETFGGWFTKEYGRESECSHFNIKTRRFRKLLDDRFGITQPWTLRNRLPAIVTRMEPKARHAMLWAMIHAEGWQESGHWRFSQLPGPVLDAFIILATLEGIRLGAAVPNKAGCITYALLDYRPCVRAANLEMEPQGYAPAWCPQTKLGSWVVRQNGQIAITGNCEFINVHDKRFDVGTLANWIQMPDLADLARVQRARFLEIVEPIASRCLGLAKGNHEDFICRKFERDIYSEIVVGVKQAGRFADDYPLALGFYGWLLLNFYRSKTRRGGSAQIRVNVHHGFVGGRLAGAKALNMQRWLWSHDCDLAIFGHSHNTSAQREAVEAVDRAGRIVIRVRRGCYAGTFLNTINDDGPSTYSERRGYFPLPIGGTEVTLRPGALNRNDMVRVAI